MAKKPRKDADIAVILGTKLRAARHALGITLAELARRVNISEEYCGRMERGGGLPSVKTLARLADALGVSLDDLLGDVIAAIPTEGGLDALPPDRQELAQDIAALGHDALLLMSRLLDLCANRPHPDDDGVAGEADEAAASGGDSTDDDSTDDDSTDGDGSGDDS